MARLPRTEWTDIASEVKTEYSTDLAQYPMLPELYSVLGNAPDMLSAWVDFAWTLRRAPKSSRRLRELLILRTGGRLSAPYCVVAHTKMAADAGATPEEIVAVDDWHASSLFGETDCACLALADAMMSRSTSDEDIARVRHLLGEEQTIEIVITIAFYIAVASVTTALDLSPGG